MATRPHQSSKLLTTPIDENKRQSFGTKSAASDTNKTALTLSNCFKVITYILLYVIGILYLITWIVATSNKRCFEKHSYSISYRLIYTIIAMILHIMIIIICLIVLIKYLIYSNKKRIQEKIKKAHKKKIKTLKKYKKSQTKDLYAFWLENYKKDKEKEQLFGDTKGHQSNNDNIYTKDDFKRMIDNESCFNKLIHYLRLTWIISTELILSLFYIEYNEFNVVAMTALSYYIFASILYFNIDNNHNFIYSEHCSDDQYTVSNGQQILYGFSSLCQSLAIVLPGMCINICQKWKCVYESFTPPEESLTFRGSRFEAGGSTPNNSVRRNSLGLVQNSPRLTLSGLTYIELRSVLNDVYVRTWIFLIFLVELIIFVLNPTVNFDDYRDELNDLFNCYRPSNDPNSTTFICDSNSSTFFTIHQLILRMFVPMTLLMTIILCISFEKKYQISRLDAMRYVISPSSISILLMITLSELYWWSDHEQTIIAVWSIIYIITAFLQCYIFMALLDIQDAAYRNRERLYGFKKTEPLTYFMEGTIVIILLIIGLTFYIFQYINNNNNDSLGMYVIIRGVGITLFNFIQLIILVPIRTIGTTPKYKNHFKQKNKKKYLRTFRWICFVNICNIIYSIIFLSDYFSDILINFNIRNDNNIYFRYAFTLSFASIHFSIWGLSQYLPWIIPDNDESNKLYTYNPGISFDEQSYMTQFGRIDNDKSPNHNNNDFLVSPPPSTNLNSNNRSKSHGDMSLEISDDDNNNNNNNNKKKKKNKKKNNEEKKTFKKKK